MRRIKNKALRYLGIALIVAGIIIIAWPSYTNFVMKRREAEIMNSWENQIVADTAQETSQTSDTSADGSQTTNQSGGTDQTQVTVTTDESQSGGTSSTGPIDRSTTVIPGETFRITIPKINSSWVGYEGTNIPSLKRGPGHYIGTPNPGELGTCVIAGHRTTYGAPFNKVDQLVNGDEIILETLDGNSYTYYVTGQLIVVPDDLSAITQTEYASLILTTCHPKYYARYRLLIFARMAETEA